MGDRIGSQIGNYRLISLLGQGGFAEVYLGEHIHLSTKAAIKLLQAPLVQAQEVEKFRQEARRIAQLSHPQIVRVLDFGFEGGLPYLILEHAPGGTLRQRHPAGVPLPLETVVTYVGQAAQALQYAHDLLVIHRDLKPQNLLLGRHGEVLLADFGISVVADSASRQSTKEFAGTISYAAPEQIQGHPQPASDQYALAVLAYEWLTGQLPFKGSLMETLWKQVQQAPQPLRTLAPNLPAAVEDVVMTALNKDPKARFGSVQAFANALAQASQGGVSIYNEVTLLGSLSLTNPNEITPTPTSDPGNTPPLPYRTPAVPQNVVQYSQPAPQAIQYAQPTPAPFAGFYGQPGGNTPMPVPVAPVPAPLEKPPRRKGNARLFVLLGLLIALLGSGAGVFYWLSQPAKGSTPPPSSTRTPHPTVVPAGMVTEFPVSTPQSQLYEIIAGPNNTLWFAEYKGNKIGRITLDGKITEFPVPAPNGGPVVIAPGPDGAIWFTEWNANKIGRLTPDTGQITEFTIPTSNSIPEGITFGPDGNLWFAETAGNQIGRLTPSGDFSEFPVPTANSHPSMIIRVGDALWFTEYDSNKIGRLTPSDTKITEFAVSAPDSHPRGIMAAPDGTIWFTESSGNHIGRLTPNDGKITEFLVPTAGSNPVQITATPDGNLWFTEHGGNHIVRLTPAGNFTEFPLPKAESAPFGITVGADGNLWFTEASANQIGRMTSGQG